MMWIMDSILPMLDIILHGYGAVNLTNNEFQHEMSGGETHYSKTES